MSPCLRYFSLPKRTRHHAPPRLEEAFPGQAMVCNNQIAGKNQAADGKYE
ncbi:MAG: hypothetical protein AAGJ93_17315 [Bacteroidota bacterium]